MVTVGAGPKIAGYTFQFERALYRLFSSEAKDAIVGIETEDDVVEIVRGPDGSINIIFEQDKLSTQSSGHPFQDSSKNLWHTLHIWLDAMKDVQEKYNNISYCLVTNKEVSTRAFAQKLGAANSENDIDECIKEIRQRAVKATGKGAVSIKAVDDFSDQDLYFLIKNLKLMDTFATASGIEPKEATIQLFHLPQDLYAKGSDIYENLLGLLVNECQKAWLAKQPLWLDKNIFANRLHSDISAYRMERYRERPLLSTPYKELLKNNNRDHVFLKQLHQVGVSDSYCDNALDHYWGFYAEKVRLQDEGDVLPSAWDARDQLLYQRWKTIGGNVILDSDENTTEVKLAKKILAKTLDSNYTAPLGHQATVHHYFTHGNYHDLANRPEHASFVHWHPSFTPQNKEEE